MSKRLANRSHEPTSEEYQIRAIVTETSRRGSPDLDAGQLQAVGAIVSGPRLVVIEGAAGAGKTTLLAGARDAHEREYRQLTVVTPTRKAARVAAEQTGATATSAAWLAHQYGFRWDENGHWTRLQPGQTDPVTGRMYEGPCREARLRPRGTLLIDEAGMLDQDTALALMTIADETRVRVAFVGDRHQLPAVGRGGVLDHAVRWVDGNGYVPLAAVHRFRDPDYADLSLRMRSGEQPWRVFDQLATDGHIAMHADEHKRTNAIVTAVVEDLVAGRGVIVAADTRAQVLELNLAIRSALVHVGVVDQSDEVFVPGGPISAGDKIVTRRNDGVLAVANRDTWSVVQVHDNGSITVTGKPGQRNLPAEYVRDHVELGYATTIHGAQGDTVENAHLVLAEGTGAAAAYVGMTRGRHTNTAHIVAATVGDAREQWATAFSRDRADLGPAAAARRASKEAVRCAAFRRRPQPVPQPVPQLPSPSARLARPPGRGISR
ncbi:MAG: ATP-dependent DNA helicase [Jatrophihabitantaceae bacterium]